MESQKTKDREDNFGGPRWYVYLVQIDALTLLLVHWRRSRRMGGLSFYPEIPLQHTSSFCKTFTVLSRYVCMNVSSVQNVGNIVVTTKKTCHFTLHRVWNIDVHNAENSISGPLGMPPDPTRGTHLRRSYLIAPLNKYSCRYEHPTKKLSYYRGLDII